ncbi:hypothetical protein D9M71_540910 [compost metagenome]
MQQQAGAGILEDIAQALGGVRRVQRQIHCPIAEYGEHTGVERSGFAQANADHWRFSCGR